MSMGSGVCRRAFLEQAKRDGAAQQNGHLQNGQAHLNGLTNGHDEHTVDIEVRACSAMSVSLAGTYLRLLDACPQSTFPVLHYTQQAMPVVFGTTRLHHLHGPATHGSMRFTTKSYAVTWM